MSSLAPPALRTAVRHGLYPLLLVGTIGFATWVVTVGTDLRHAFGWVMGARFALLFGLEFLMPMRREWGMSWRSAFRDAMYIVVNGGMGMLIRWTLVFFAISFAGKSSGLARELPLVLQVIAAVLMFELFQYALHRASHEARGPLGRWLWRVHVAHHLPDRVYLLMHAVMHPFNIVFIFAITQGAMLLVGLSPEALFIFNALLALHGLIGHFNVEIKAGPLNYLFVGTELHRDHHSADPQESKNYGVLTPFWDIVFGTFHYRPGRSPARLGVEHPDRYPDSIELHKVVALPLLPPR